MPHMIKNWRIFNWTPDDVEWLKTQGISNQLATVNVPVAHGNSVTYMRGDMGLSCVTDTNEQETLLRLKFEPNLHLMLEELVLDQPRECTLSEIKF